MHVKDHGFSYEKVVILAVVMLVVGIITGNSGKAKLEAQAEKWGASAIHCSESLDAAGAKIDRIKEQYGDALDEANAKLENAGDAVWDARWAAGESYDEMEDAIRDLSSIDLLPVREPYVD